MDTKYYNVDDAYKKNKNLKVEDVVLLQNWLEKQSHLPKICEHNIIFFLHRCKFDIERTKERIETFYSVRGRWPEYMQVKDILSAQLKRANRTMLTVVLPISAKQNEIIVYCRLYNTDPNEFELVGVSKLYELALIAASNEIGSTDGLIMIMDAEGYTMNHFLKTNAMFARKYLFYVQQGSPIRIKAIHICNTSTVADTLLNFIKPMLKKNTSDKLIVHRNIETLYEYVPKEGLPNECGGNAGTFEELHERQIKFLEENAEFILEDQENVTDESKRMGKLTNLDDIFGTEGTFKKIDNID